MTPWTAAHQAVLCYLPKLAQIHVHWVGDAIQPPHPLLSPSPPTFNLSQHQGLFHESALCIRWPNFGASASVLPMNIQDWFPLGLIGLILLSKGLSKVFSSTTVQKHQFFGFEPSFWSSGHICTWLLKKPIVLTIDKVIPLLFNKLCRFFIAFLPRNKLHGCSHCLQWF